MSTLELYRAELATAQRYAGRNPVVCVVGSNDYTGMVAELKTLFNAELIVKAVTHGLICFDLEGVQILENPTRTQGFNFGFLPEKK